MSGCCPWQGRKGFPQHPSFLPVQVPDEILRTQSREFRSTSSLCVVPVYLPEALPKNLSKMSSGDPFGIGHIMTLQLPFYSPINTSPAFLQFHILLKFSLEALPPNSSSFRKRGQDKIFNEFCTSLKHWKDQFFLIDRRAIPDAMSWRHQNSSVADPPPTGVRAEDIHRLCENIIDLCPVHSAMLYAIGLTTIWKHVGHHPVFKDGEGTVATNMSQFLKFLMVGGIPEKSDHQKVVEYENERVLAAKKKAQAARDKATEKGDDSTRSGSETHHSASPLNTIISDDVDPMTSGGSLVLEFVMREEDDADHSLDNIHMFILVELGLHHGEGDEQTYRHASGSSGHVVSSSTGGSGRLAFPKRNPSGDGAGNGYDKKGQNPSKTGQNRAQNGKRGKGNSAYIELILSYFGFCIGFSNLSSNPTPSTNPNPKGRNRRRSKQRIEDFNLEELSPPIVTMADQRTMAQLLQAPTEGYEDAIVVPAITADNFELKHGLLTLV
uniref:Putative transposase (Putative), gypsy type n=1 Tax=Tanacetum cinerariifolium TaxID=118510 RepID=A0A699GH21_TANCI|nr:putative transposase (putative), gypsy type [Tanacetum cinerariifolium]